MDHDRWPTTLPVTPEQSAAALDALRIVAVSSGITSSAPWGWVLDAFAAAPASVGFARLPNALLRVVLLAYIEQGADVRHLMGST